MSSLWREANKSGTFGNGMKIKVKVLISASGNVASFVMHSYRMPECDLSVLFIVLEVEGHTIGGKLKLGRKMLSGTSY